MTSFEVGLILRRNGFTVEGFPVTHRFEADEVSQFTYEKANDGDTTTFSALPADQIDTIQVLVVRASKAVTIRLDGQADKGIRLNAGGMLVIVDGTIDAGAGASNAKVNNNSGAVSLIEGIAAGT
jgi:hypothetical protein